MQVYGVGKDGGFLTLNNDVIIRVEYGNYYYTENNERFKFIYIRPDKRPVGYKEGPFQINDANANGKLKMSVLGEIKSFRELDIEMVLKDSVKSIGGFDNGTNYKVVKNDSEAKMGYYYKTVNLLGMEVRSYGMYVFTKYNNGYSIEASFSTSNHKENEKYLEKFLKSLKIIEESVREKNKLKMDRR